MVALLAECRGCCELEWGRRVAQAMTRGDPELNKDSWVQISKPSKITQRPRSCRDATQKEDESQLGSHAGSRSRGECYGN
jgi:hypothetical protein